MTELRTFASQIVAASTALALSLVLISGTVTTPSAATSSAPAQEILA